MGDVQATKVACVVTFDTPPAGRPTAEQVEHVRRLLYATVRKDTEATKRREDGFPAGSEAAKAADREKAKQRMAAKRAGLKASALPAARNTRTGSTWP